MRIPICTDWRSGLLIASLCFSSGCGGASPTSAAQSDGPTARPALEDLGGMLKAIAEDKKRPPSRPAELEPYEVVYLSATTAIHRGTIEYQWGAGLKPGSTAVIANEQKVGTQGGWVLLQDGTLKEMTAADFQAAPKAGKK